MSGNFAARDAVLVCGLGRVGQECIKALRGYRVPVRAIDFRAPQGVTLDVGALTVGDFRVPETLQRAGIQLCRSIVLVSSDSAANIEGALAARRANPAIRVVLRSDQHSWHDLLSKKLGNAVVYEPNRLAADAFALATLDTDVVAHFYVDHELFQVVEHELVAGDRAIGMPVEALHMPRSQVLMHAPARVQSGIHSTSSTFSDWEPERTLAEGDRVLLLTTGRPRSVSSTPAAQPSARKSRKRAHWIRRTIDRLERPEKIALAGVLVLTTLLLSAMASFVWNAPHMSVHEALRLSLMLLTGGHLADVFANFDQLPARVKWVELLLTVTGTLLTAVLYALLTDRLLTARFQLLTRRPRAPSRSHVIVAGLGATGERVAATLQQLQQPLLAIEREPVDHHVLPSLPVVQGNASDPTVLEQAKLRSALGLVAATAHDLKNVEIALLVSSLNPRCRLAVRTFEPRLTENVSLLLPHARVLCVSSLAATAYAAAALGEHVIGLFQAFSTPILVVEYRVSRDDTLVGRPLWEVAEGYSVVPVLHQTPGGQAHILALDETGGTLQAGDRLVVLATAASLEAIERGELHEPKYELVLEKLRPYAEPLQLVGLLSQQLGFSLEKARDVLSHLPQVVTRHVYGLHGSRTQRALRASGVQTSLRLCNSGREAVAARESREMVRVDWTGSSRV